MGSWKTPWYMPSMLHGLLYEQGLMDMSPMVDYLDKYFADFEKIEKKLVLSALDVESGEFTRFNETMGIENLGLLIRASGSVPVVFNPAVYNGRMYMDAGTVWNLNLIDAVDRCLEMVDDEEHVVVDVIITEFVELSEEKKTYSAWWNYARKR